jgi:hypothetical protein
LPETATRTGGTGELTRYDDAKDNHLVFDDTIESCRRWRAAPLDFLDAFHALRMTRRTVESEPNFFSTLATGPQLALAYLSKSSAHGRSSPNQFHVDLELHRRHAANTSPIQPA